MPTGSQLSLRAGAEVAIVSQRQAGTAFAEQLLSDDGIVVVLTGSHVMANSRVDRVEGKLNEVAFAQRRKDIRQTSSR
jgi:hypothetical protein